MLTRFLKHIKDKKLIPLDSHLLLAVSGGVDSVVLADLCVKAGFNFSIAHCNFQLRGEESVRDEEFVQELAKKNGVAFHLKKFETENFANKSKMSVQESARHLRYGWFDELVREKQITVGDNNVLLLTAHHTDDNIETLLMNFFRGTGLHGLTSIPEKVGYLRRPLLIFTKEELLAYAGEKNLAFVEDSSNQSSKYTRNYFRNELLPAITNVYPQVRENLRNNIERFKSIEALYRLSVGQLKSKLLKIKGKEVHIPVKQLAAFNNRALIYEIISPYGFTEKQVEEVGKLFDSESGKYVKAPTDDYRIIRHRHWLIISPVANETAVTIIIEKEDQQVDFTLGKLIIEEVGSLTPSTDNNSATIDSRFVTYPLFLRKYKTGDYFYPLGMRKKKKVARFLIDQKFSKTQKENVWVLESDKKIIWVVGYRIDDRVKITNNTKTAIRFELQS